MDAVRELIAQVTQCKPKIAEVGGIGRIDLDGLADVTFGFTETAVLKRNQTQKMD